MPLIRYVFNLEFATDDFELQYRHFLFFAVPIAVILTLCGTVKGKDSIPLVTGKLLGTLALAALSVFLMFGSALSSMCTYTNKEVLFEKKDDPNTQIIVREFGCGAVDGGPPVISVHKVNHFTNFFIRSSRIDTSTIDKNNWVKVVEPND